ncbi:MAG TPA: ATPase, T2SS/T4P/T4SS family, partial [Orrella sp.]
DRIVVGECRGAEAIDMLAAMNTGHDGSLTTLHANSPRDAISRLETMVLMAGKELPLLAIRDQIARAIQLIVQQTRLTDGRRMVTAVDEITGLESGQIQLQPLVRFSAREQTSVPQGLPPTFMPAWREQGVPDLDVIERWFAQGMVQI